MDCSQLGGKQGRGGGRGGYLGLGAGRGTIREKRLLGFREAREWRRGSYQGQGGGKRREASYSRRRLSGFEKAQGRREGGEEKETTMKKDKEGDGCCDGSERG